MLINRAQDSDCSLGTQQTAQGVCPFPNKVKRQVALCTISFQRWLANLLKEKGEAVAKRTDDFDQQISSYIQTAWEEGDSRSHVANLLCGLAHRVPRLHRQRAAALAARLRVAASLRTDSTPRAHSWLAWL